MDRCQGEVLVGPNSSKGKNKMRQITLTLAKKRKFPEERRTPSPREFYYTPMPTATVIRCTTWRCGSTSSYPSSVAEDAVPPSDDGGIGHHQEVVKNSKDASIIKIRPRMKKTIHNKKPVVTRVKKSQPGGKAIAKTRKRCSHEGCANRAVKGGVCVTHGAKLKQCSFEGATRMVTLPTATRESRFSSTTGT